MMLPDIGLMQTGDRPLVQMMRPLCEPKRCMRIRLKQNVCEGCIETIKDANNDN